MLQIVEESERVGALADIERDILLAELREAYTELKFGEERSEEIGESSEEIAEPIAEEPAVAELPIAPNTPSTRTTPTNPTSKRSALLSLYEDNPTPVLGEQFHETPSVADTIACPKGVAESTPVASLREAIGLADKFMLIRELFGGDAEAYDKAISELDEQPSFDDCIIYIAEHYTWSPNAESTKMVMELLQRKYN